MITIYIYIYIGPKSIDVRFFWVASGCCFFQHAIATYTWCCVQTNDVHTARKGPCKPPMGRRCHLLVLIIRVQMTVLPTECLFVSFIICLHSSKYFIIQVDCARSMPAQLHSRSWHQCERLKSSTTMYN